MKSLFNLVVFVLLFAAPFLFVGCKPSQQTARHPIALHQPVGNGEDSPEEFAREMTAVMPEGPFAAAATIVTYEDECHCDGNHGVWRWTAKTEEEMPPAAIPPSHDIRPSDIAAWAGPGGDFHKDTPRSGKELQWFTVTGQVTKVKAEADGDLHVQLVDADGSGDVEIVVEFPMGSTWCAMRHTVFGWTGQNFPFTTKSGRTLKLVNQPTITVTGRAFYDAIHVGGSPDGTDGNRRFVNGAPTNVTVWEIHPVMNLTVH